MSSASCFHCELPIPDLDQGRFVSKIVGADKNFCCPACLAVSEMIAGAGLGDFYQKREGQKRNGQPSLPEGNARDYTVWDDPKQQATFVKTNHSNELDISLYIEGMHCTACAWLIEKHCENLDGIVSAQVNFSNQKLTVRAGNLIVSDLMAWVAQIGYLPHPYKNDQIQNAIATERRKQLKRIGITALLMMQLGMLAAGVYAGDFLGISEHHRQLLHAAGLFFSLPLLYFSALPFITSAVVSLKNKQINMDVNIVIAILGLYGGSVVSVWQREGDVYFDSIAMLCLFILIARFVEFSSRHSMRLTEGLPELVTRIKEDNLQTVLREHIDFDDLVFIKEGEMIGVDGVVVDGESSVEEALLTGEPSPLKKQVGDTVLAGSINHDGQLTVKATKAFGETRFEQIAAMLDNSAGAKEGNNAIAASFTLVVALLALATFFGWLFVDPDRAFWVALSVLVISCPCAFSLALPTAQSAALSQLKKMGILVADSQVLLKVPNITHCIFDKTGTLTEPRFSIEKMQLADSGWSTGEILSIAASLEKVSRHPLASAFNQPNAVLPDSSKIFVNQGVEGGVNDERFRIGSKAFLADWLSVPEPPKDDLVWVGLSSKQKFLGWFGLSCQLRVDARQTIEALKAFGAQCEILSGDNSSQVEKIANTLDVPFIKNATSKQKQERIRMLGKQGSTLMVGDGVNDALALSKADISVTLGESTDWVKQLSDVVISSNKLSGASALIDVSTKFKRIYRQNTSWALAYNFLAIPFAMMGLVSPLVAAIGMCVSSIVVVCNSTRLNSN
jgi:Cu2+-exporting ATPase